MRLQNRSNVFSWPICIDNISGILQFLYSFFNFVMKTKIKATVTSLNKVGPTINQSHADYSRFLVTISLIVTANSYLGAQKASQTRLFQPCFFKQVQTARKIGSNLDHFDQYQSVFFRSRFLLLSGTLGRSVNKGFWLVERTMLIYFVVGGFANGGNANTINFLR